MPNTFRWTQKEALDLLHSRYLDHPERHMLLLVQRSPALYDFYAVDVRQPKETPTQAPWWISALVAAALDLEYDHKKQVLRLRVSSSKAALECVRYALKPVQNGKELPRLEVL